MFIKGLISATITAAIAIAAVHPQTATTTKILETSNKPETTEIATLAGGCFWKMDASYQQLKGVTKVEVGYAGGTTKNPTYEDVSSRTTGHAETVQVTFDPAVVSYREILDVFWEIHDASVLNQEGNDKGDDYRSAVFYRSEAQKKVAEEVLADLNKTLKYGKPLVTAIEQFKNFYKAEAYHQNYYNQHPNEGYCYGVVRKKVEHFQQIFKDKLKTRM
jgi:peptide-methionine (S)-S-oxide reductase